VDSEVLLQEEKSRLKVCIDQELQTLTNRELFLEKIRVLKKNQVATLVKKEESGEIGFEEFLVRMTALAEVCLLQVYRFERAQLKFRYGAPKSAFYIIGMGKLGGYEMTVGSDLDLIFIYESAGRTEGGEVLTNQEYFVRLVQRMISHLSVQTEHGRVYEVDTRLRPSGRAGVLVTSWHSFKEYHHKRARMWERQALLKARSIDSRHELCIKMNERLDGLRWNAKESKDLAREINELRIRMEQEVADEDETFYDVKLGVGGIVDIEFAVQYLQLMHGADCSAIHSTQTLSALRALQLAGLLRERLAEDLSNAYLFFRRLETAIRLRTGRGKARLPRLESEALRGLKLLPEGLNYREIVREYETFRSLVRSHYNRILGTS
jgi:[glutamine synthetase] adenylyltransferase / [glutamine synthetase]-adenylyl-L-tyrosine phosphorylase